MNDRTLSFNLCNEVVEIFSRELAKYGGVPSRLGISKKMEPSPIMSALRRNNVVIRGKGSQAMMFAHGFGCDQSMWRFVAPAFEDSYQTVLFDHVGAGGSDLSAYSREKYNTLEGYAADIVEIAVELGLKDAV